MASPLHLKNRVSRAQARFIASIFQQLESRRMLSSSLSSSLAGADDGLIAHTNYEVDGTPSPDGSFGHANVVGLTPAQIKHAYGIDSLSFVNGTVTGNGSGQTIAIIDAENNPNFYSSSDTVNYPTSDLAKFCTQFNLPQFGSGGPTFSKLSETGGTTYPPSDTGWASEIALDVEWAHAIAPQANIMLIECNGSNSDLFNSGVVYAANHGATVISMSFGVIDSSGNAIDTTTYENDFKHAGVTYVASTGDDGSPSGSPADSPNVLAVGGTHLSINGSNAWSSETGWSGSGGGYSTAFAKPSYQSSLTISDPNNKRMAPDISFDADPNTGVAIYDSYGYGSASAPWVQIGGTSLSSPCWAGMIAIADQGRLASGLSGTLTTSDTTNALDVQKILYSLPSTDFHDITSGSNGHGTVTGFTAGTGYDMVTGLGSPIANLLIPDLAGIPQTPAAPTGLTLSTASDSGVSHSDEVTNITTPTLTGTATGNSIVKLYANSVLVGQGTATSAGAFSIATSSLANGVFSMTATATTSGGTSSASTGMNIAIDTVAPTIGTLSFNPNATSMTVTVPFSENVSGGLFNGSLSVSGISGSSQALSFNTGTGIASYTFTPGYTHGILPDGNYVATLPIANVTDIAGNHPTAAPSVNFFILDGDANFDRAINALDFNALATNYGLPNKLYVNGDFNYDGTVNSSDFSLLAGKFGKLLAAADVPDDGNPASDPSAVDPPASDPAAAPLASSATAPASVFSDQSISQHLANDLLA